MQNFRNVQNHDDNLSDLMPEGPFYQIRAQRKKIENTKSKWAAVSQPAFIYRLFTLTFYINNIKSSLFNKSSFFRQVPSSAKWNKF